eukprot:9445609-Pyramimonas_sp.AAC.1
MLAEETTVIGVNDINDINEEVRKKLIPDTTSHQPTTELPPLTVLRTPSVESCLLSSSTTTAASPKMPMTAKAINRPSTTFHGRFTWFGTLEDPITLQISTGH